MNAFEAGLEKNGANYVPLSPLTFLKRAAGAMFVGLGFKLAVSR